MDWQFNPYTIALFIVSAVLAATTYFVWRRRTTPGARLLTILILSIALWTLGRGLEIGNTSLAGTVFWAKAQYIAVESTILALAAFAAQYTGREHWLTLRNLALLAVIPCITIAAVWTNEMHQLVWQNVTLNLDGPMPDMHFSRGPWYWVNVAYTYLILLAAAGMFLLAVIRSHYLYRGQAFLIVVSVLAPWAMNILYIAGIDPLPGMDLTPFAFAVSGLALALSLFRYRLLDIMPVAHTEVIGNLPDAVMVLDCQDRVVDLNPAARQLIGGDMTVVGQDAGVVLAQWPNLIDKYKGAQAAFAQITLETAGATRHFDLRISPLRSRRGRLIVLRDNTDLLRAIAEREALIEELEKLVEDLDAFSHTVAHDLKTPLSVISGYALLLKDKFDQLSESQRQIYLHAIARGTHKMHNIIEALLLLASVRRMEEVELSPLDMARVVSEAQQRLANIIQEYNATVVIPNAWPAALGYAPWVEEVWANYLSNACKYGGEPPYIELGAKPQSNGKVCFWVHDNGPGIAPEQQGQLFTQFTRLEQAKVEGHGLGLSIVHRIVTKLGGEVGVDSAPGAGSTFSFTLPTASLGHKEMTNAPSQSTTSARPW
ncbi:MAG: PAS domain-containing protein [Anaerolineae bacterium]|nr:PAS domain-containing protein [Anaerolineae bacterium]